MEKKWFNWIFLQFHHSRASGTEKMGSIGSFYTVIGATSAQFLYHKFGACT
jgi:hypothetical protein